MRILHMIPDIGISNGVMSVILNYFRAMPADIKFDVVYFSEKEKTRQSDIEALGGRVFKINAPSPKGALKGEMSRFFSAHKKEWEALHIHAPHFAVFMAPQAKKAGIKKICCHCHSTWYSLEAKNEKRNKLLASPVKMLTDTQFACGREAGEFWYKNGFYVLPNAVDCSAYRYNAEKRNSLRDKLDLSDKFVVGHVGRVYPPQKNHPFLFKIFAEVKKACPNAVLLLAGAERDEFLEQLADKLNIASSVYFLGQRKDIPDLLLAMDLFLFPSFKEGLPVAVVEAQASGLPVLMADTITDEVMITDNIHTLSLDESPQIWAEKALKMCAAGRKDTFGIMKKSGWDIKTCAARLADYYKSGTYSSES